MKSNTTIKKKRKRKLDILEMVNMYQNGCTTSSIAKNSNVSARYVRMVLKEQGIELKPIGSWRRKYSVNEDFFKEWSKNMAYILGFFLADGTVHKKLQRISFAQKEKQILDKVNQEMSSNYSVYQRNNIYILDINSKIMKNDLINIHGIKPNKSKDVEFPKIPKQYLNHFIRGYFDGDGFVNYTKYFISFVGGSKKFMVQLQKVLEHEGYETNFTDHSNYFRVYISGRKTLMRFSDWIYSNLDSRLYLERKYKIFQQEKLQLNDITYKRLKRNKNAVQERKEKFIIGLKQNKDIQQVCYELCIKTSTYRNWLRDDNEFKQRVTKILSK